MDFYLWPPRSRHYVHPAVRAAHPPGYFDIDEYEPARCDWGCGRRVLDEGQVCDHCLVANALRCGDWDEEEVAAFQRLNPHDPFL